MGTNLFLNHQDPASVWQVDHITVLERWYEHALFFLVYACPRELNATDIGLG